ncbi:hypothetical protein V7152_28320 [Neobacillus drentensis]|uniref:hypothetical protein n=1 Tax=Neobacillus drentensis TaxID=220684 RepID=UPI002FFE8A31
MFNLTSEQLNTVKDELRNLIINVAKQQARISYSVLCSQVKSTFIEPDSHLLAYLLDQISREEDAGGRGMLSVVVVHKDGDMQPGNGFYKLEKQLGKDTSDRLAFWMNEFNKVHAFWRGK